VRDWKSRRAVSGAIPALLALAQHGSLAAQQLAWSP
jgi:hypothetical protein